MTIYEISEKYSISIRKLRRMQKDDYLICDHDHDHDEEEDFLSKTREVLAKRQHLTVVQLVALIEQQSLLWGLGRYKTEAVKQLVALGDPCSELPPIEVTAEIFTAGRGDPHSVGVVVDWLRSVIPPHRVPYHWIGVRLLLSVDKALRKQAIARLPSAVARCRKHRDFAGWSSVETVRHRRQSFYQRPETPFDL